CVPAMAMAQGTGPPAWLTGDATAGSRAEGFLMDRMLGGTGLSVSIRSLSPRALDSIRALVAGGRTPHESVVEGSRWWMSTWYNTGRASSDFTGPVWAGRGATIAASAGVQGRRGVWSYELRPVVFWSENRPYTQFDNQGTPVDFQSAWTHGQLDLPYRFGSQPYSRVDAGESFLRVDGRWGAAGISNAAQVWGPARLQPLLISSNAGGFPHAFLETGVPRSIGIGRVEARWIAGKLSSSSFAPVHAGTHNRAIIGAVAVFLPRGMDGLELGAARVFHQYVTPVAYDFHSLTLPIQALFKDNIRISSDPRRETNQLASAFFRLAPPRSPVEVYGEYMRDDHNADLRDLVGEPDHDASVLLGLRWKSTDPGGVGGRAVTIENVNARMSHLNRVRSQAPPYLHSSVVEGHTQNGMLLGSPAALGGGGLQVRVERYHARGAWWVDAAVTRLAQDSEGGVFQGEPTGEFTIGAGRTFVARGLPVDAGIRYQPPFGHLKSANLQLHLAVSKFPR
ncbi:MAG TPA: capsule assembly Wzi family protein, partial [Gemmatimonadaceae bacterium]